MKNQNKLVTVTLTAIAAMFITQARAQDQAVNDGSIAASPKVRQMLNDLSRSKAKPQAERAAAYAGNRAPAHHGIAASPKVRMMLAEQAGTPAVMPLSTVIASANYRAVGDDGIAASPKLREQFNECALQTFQGAPVK